MMPIHMLHVLESIASCAMTETQGVDVRKRLEGLKQSVEGAQGFDIVPAAIIGTSLMMIAVGVWIIQRRRRAAQLQQDRRRRRDDAERRRKRLAHEAGQKQRFTISATKSDELAEACPVTDILDIRPGVSAALVSKRPGHIPSRVTIKGSDDAGLHLVPDPRATAPVPEGEMWLSVRKTGGTRLYPVTVERRASAAHVEAIVATTTGPGWEFSRFSRHPTDLHAIAMPTEGSRPPDEQDAVPVRILSLGIGSAEITGPLELDGGARAVIRIALPEEMESATFPARVRSRSRDDAGRDIIEVAFDSVPGPTLDILARSLARQLDDAMDSASVSSIEPVSATEP